MLLKLKQPQKKRKFRVRVRKADLPPLYTPHPDSVLPHRRCFRADCRAIKPVGITRCLICGSYADSTEPLIRFTIYVEEVHGRNNEK
jgi:hypothetical protein